MVCRIDRFTDRELNLMKSARDEILNEVVKLINKMKCYRCNKLLCEFKTLEADEIKKQIKKLREK
jgi:hypothetical protein